MAVKGVLLTEGDPIRCKAEPAQETLSDRKGDCHP